jgi:hypothetical protein
MNIIFLKRFSLPFYPPFVQFDADLVQLILEATKNNDPCTTYRRII